MNTVLTGKRRGALAVAALLAVSLSRPGAAGAEDEKKGGYGFASFLGGVAVPMAEMSEGRQEGLATVARFGFTGQSGFGLELSAEYSPLPYEPDDRATTIQTHFGLLSLAPRFTLGGGTVRAWMSAGGGVALERTTTSVRGMKEGSVFYADPVAVGAAGIELHFFQNGGLTVTGSYAHTVFGDDPDARLATVLAGLVFTF